MKTKLNILYIEDDPLDRMAVERLVRNKRLNFRLFLTESIQETKELIKRKQLFDVVIADYLLKDGNAFEIFDLGYPAPIIFVTGAGDEEVAVKAMKSGAYDYIIKDKDRNYLKILPITIINAYKNYQAKNHIQLLEATVLNTNDAIVITTADIHNPAASPIIFVNEAFCKLTGYKINEILQGFFDKFIGAKTDRIELKRIDKKLRNFEAVRSEVIYYSKEGSPIWLDINIVPIFNKLGICTHFVSVSRDISKIKENEAALIRAKLESEYAKKAEEHFLAVISHEIRTPINAVVGLANLMLDTSTTNEQAEYIDSIKTSADNLLALVNDILDLSKIENGQIDFAQNKFELEKLITNSINTLKFVAENRGITISLVKDANLPNDIIGDAVRLNQIIINLLSNAIKFTIEGEVIVKIKLILQHKEKIYISISVKDTGIGIAAEKLDLIFEKYKQADQDVMMRYGGSGLGLYIVKQLVELQGGEINVKSQQGIGSTFSVTLPFDMVEENEPIQKVLNQQSDLQNISVLIGEDNIMNQHIVKKMLEKWKATVDIATNGREVIQKITDNKYDVLLTDIQMPKLNGLETIDYIRKKLKSDIPIVIMTASVFGRQHEVMKNDISGFIQKPFDPQKLLQSVNEAIAKKKRADEIKKLLPHKQQNAIRYDLSYLEKVSGNNRKFIQEMIQIFVTQADEIIEVLPTILEKQDFTLIARMVHKIKSSARNIGDKQMAQNCATIENLIETHKDYSHVPKLVEQFITDCQTTKMQLSERLTEMSV
ncbi:MAG: response regulator [Chitinophagales bacterium]